MPRYNESDKQQYVAETNKRLAARGLTILGLQPDKGVKHALCKMHCEKHGNGDEWGTPWRITANQLEKGLGCPKCSGLYKLTEDELWKALSRIPTKTKDVSLEGRVTAFKSSNTRYSVLCKHHGSSGAWGHPYTPVASSIKQLGLITCPKCEGKYKASPDEMFDALSRSLEGTSVSLIDWVEGRYAGNLTRCIVECEVHGPGLSWGRPWTPDYGNLMAGTRCPKCTKSYRPTPAEYLAMSQEKAEEYDAPLKVTGFMGEYNTIWSRLRIHCDKHGEVLTQKKGHYSVKNILEHGACCHPCRKGKPSTIGLSNPYDAHKKGEITLKTANAMDAPVTTAASRVLGNKKQELIDGVTSVINSTPKLSLVGFDSEHITGSSTCLLQCDIHGKLWEFDNPQAPLIKAVLSSGGHCAKCAQTYKHTEQELFDEVDATLRPYNCSVVDILPGHWLSRKVNMKCAIHGHSNEWGTPWQPTAKSLIDIAHSGVESICIKCSNQYLDSQEEVIGQAQIAAHQRGLVCHGTFGDWRTISQLKVSCPTHGNAWEWDTPWLPYAQVFIKDGRDGCPKCRGLRNLGASDVVEKANEFWSGTDWSAIDIHGELKGTRTRLKAVCTIHGNGWEWMMPWVPKLDKIRSGKGCSKCGGTHRLSKKEILTNAKAVSEQKGLSFHGVLGDVKGIASLLDVECPTHGRGKDMAEPWAPTYRELIDRSSGCRLCMKNARTLALYLDSLDEGEPNQLRRLYYVAFRDNKGQLFYKIGLASHHNGVEGRYYSSELKRDRLAIVWYKEALMDNGLAILLEAATLVYFDAQRDWRRRGTLKYVGGGTECFGSDIVDDIDFNMLLDFAIKNHISLARDKRLYGNSMTECPQERLASYIDSARHTMPPLFDKKKSYNKDHDI